PSAGGPQARSIARVRCCSRCSKRTPHTTTCRRRRTRRSVPNSRARRRVGAAGRLPHPSVLGNAQVDITINLNLRVRVGNRRDDKQGRPPDPGRGTSKSSERRGDVTAPQNYLAVIKVVGIGGGGVN